jgi:hypothetical protein
LYFGYDEASESLSYEDYRREGFELDRMEFEIDGMGKFGDKLDWDVSE